MTENVPNKYQPCFSKAAKTTLHCNAAYTNYTWHAKTEQELGFVFELFLNFRDKVSLCSSGWP